MSPSIDVLLRASNPAPDEAVRALRSDALAESTDALRRAILAEPRTVPPTPRKRRHRRMPALAAATALIAVAAVFGVASLDRFEVIAPSSGQAWAASAVRVANAVPRRLVGEPGWAVLQADEFTVEDGAMTFAKNDRAVELRWTVQDQRMLLADRAMSSDLGARSAQVGSTRARIFHYASTKDDFAAIWSDGGRYTLELRTHADRHSLTENSDGSTSYAQGYTTGFTLASFEALLRSIHAVPVDDWLAAMPPSVVKPQDTRLAVADMLRDIPQPPGFEQRGLIDAGGGAVHDRYQLGARVVGAVACGWIEEWIAAKRAGDTVKRDAAVDVLAGSRNWAIVKEMEPGGGYPLMLSDYVTAMRTGGSPPAGRKTTVERSYRSALGCEGP